MKHGEVGTNENSHARWCAICNQYHASLYNCENYPIELREEIDLKVRKLLSSLQTDNSVEATLLKCLMSSSNED